LSSAGKEVLKGQLGSYCMAGACVNSLRALRWLYK